MHWYGPRMGGWGWALGLGSLVFWALVVVAVVVLVRYFVRGQRPLPPYQGYGAPPGPYGRPGPAAGPPPATPEQILAERFARGDIGEEEFRQRMAVLREEPSQPGPAGPSA